MDVHVAAQILGVAAYTVRDVNYDFERDCWVASVRDMATHEIVDRVIPGEHAAPVLAVTVPMAEAHALAADRAAELERIEDTDLAAAADVADVPAGSVAEVVEWVGGDPERALKALVAERLRDRPRRTLTDALEPLLVAEPTTEEDR